MKKTIFAVLCLLIAFNCLNVINASATNDDLRVTYALPDDVSQEPMAPYSISSQSFEETTEEEGNNPLYVLVFRDEEERPFLRRIGYDTGIRLDNPISSLEWAEWQIERGDEALVANFGIDIRILGFEAWDSDDSKDSMYDLWYELESDTEQYLHQWYEGEYWSNYVDAIIGITAQNTPADPDPIAGLSPSPSSLDQGRTFILLRWQVCWADDNLVQHEVSHLYYAPDHRLHCCAMAYHTHFRWFILEDGGIWAVFAHVDCSYTSYHWCDDCYQVIYQNRYRYGAGGGGETCPTLFTWDGTDYVDYGVIPIHDPTGEDMVKEVPVLAEDVGISHSKAKFRLREGWPGLEFSESAIDQVKLYAVNEEGEQNLCPLISAEHSIRGNVLPQLLFSDDFRVETHLLETIDLTFVVPYRNVEGFTFVVEGCNAYKM